MNIELITFKDRRIPEAHISSSPIPSRIVPLLEFETEPGERHAEVEAVTVFKSRRSLRKWLAERGYDRFREMRHRVMAVSL